MNTVFPVTLEIPSSTGEKSTPRFLQAFTRDVSAGGLCLEFKSSDATIEEFFQSSDASVALTIEVPFAKRPIQAVARVAWFRKQEEFLPHRCLIGVSYTQIDEPSKSRLIRYAKRLLWIPRVTIVAGVLLIGVLVVLFVHDQKLIAQNKAIVNRLVESAEKESGISSRLQTLQKQEAALEHQLAISGQKIQNLEASAASMAEQSAQEKEAYQKDLSESLEKQKKIDEELKRISEDKGQLEMRYEKVKKEGAQIEWTGLQQMVEWIGTHRNLHTGLVASFEGDASLEDWAFTYDQSLACQVFLLFDDPKSAEAILSFYDEKAQRSGGAYYNAYDAVGGQMEEGIVHTGPNVWLGIAALQYEHRVKDGRFLPLAKRIGSWIMDNQDPEGGLKGGPTVDWYSTEHNLDAYAFLKMLNQETGDPRYTEAADKVLGWIKKYAYTTRPQRMNRGKGDATIATDTFSWAIAALTPATLRGLSLDPEEIMQFAETHCEVSVNYTRPGGKSAVARGFDFAKAQNIGRGGVISTEWTAQTIVTYQILSTYFNALGEKEKASRYLQKARFYLSELQKLVITSPSRTGQGRGCLPYASADNVDTGHGWRTPKGQRTGSVSGTAYGIFAWVGYNPFSFDNPVKKAS